VKAVAEPFHLLPVELSFFLQDQGHNTLAAQVVGQVFLPEAIGRHQFAQHLDPRSLFDNEMLCFVIGDQNDEQFGSFRFFRCPIPRISAGVCTPLMVTTTLCLPSLTSSVMPVGRV